MSFSRGTDVTETTGAGEVGCDATGVLRFLAVEAGDCGESVGFVVSDLDAGTDAGDVATGTSDAGLRVILAIASTLINPPTTRLLTIQVGFCQFFLVEYTSVTRVFCEEDNSWVCSSDSLLGDWATVGFAALGVGESAACGGLFPL